ncbi:MAG: ankyrin repeat domain-containing protein [Patescibacteria group bacterium]|nr:ankyrin repeat domain-containing protein [Patescibacteria group bacterium]
MAKYVVDADGFILQGTFKGYHLIHIAAKDNCVDLIEANKEFVNIAAKTSQEETPLHIGVSFMCSISALNALLRCDAETEAKNKLGQTPLLYACVNANQAGRIESLLAHKANPNARSSIGDTPIMRAVAFGPAENVKLLIDGGAEIDAVQTGGYFYRGWSAIEMCRDSECLDLLERARKFQESEAVVQGTARIAY